jgi:hypothetical protein
MTAQAITVLPVPGGATSMDEVNTDERVRGLLLLAGQRDREGELLSRSVSAVVGELKTVSCQMEGCLGTDNIVDRGLEDLDTRC